MTIPADQFFHALSNITRLRCLALLVSEAELCVCEFTHALETVQPTISRHLAQLRDLQIVRDRREGLWIYYQLNPDLPEWAKQTLHSTVQGIGQTSPYINDSVRLADMADRPERCC